MHKQYRGFIKAISDYGLYVDITSKHLKIMKNGHMVTCMASTPGDIHVAIDSTLRYLINDGYLPKVNRRNYEHELKLALR